MIPELGQWCLMLALCLALIQALFPLWGSLNNTPAWLALARPLAWGQNLFVTLAFVVLIYAFWIDDFSVAYVAQNSNTMMPTVYKISAVWGAHEGSLLLWAWLLSAWGAAVAVFSRHLPPVVVARVLAVLAMVAVGFLLFMLVTSNPFGRLWPIPPEGHELNPLLQDPGLALHPPLLYMGYVGFSVAFSFAIAALIGGKLDATWARWSRPWTLIAWIFLTLGITLGSWWAYYELGWGGWWFWDPVENASLMPWLVGTALIHSLAVTEKRGALKIWTVLLALCAFSLSLLGTFLVRSGVLTSVHAFATDPTRGAFILAFLCIVIGGSLTLYAWRAPRISSGGRFDFWSRESLLLGNNLLLTVLAALVLFGTLAPLIYDALGWGKISVGFPWFNTMFIALTPLLALLMGFGPLLRWKRDYLRRLSPLLGLALLFSLMIAGLSLARSELTQNWRVALGLGLLAWLLSSHAVSLWERSRLRKQGLLPIPGASTGRSYYGMWLAHLGVAMFVLGVTLVSHYGIEQDLRMSPGDRHELAGYTFVFEGVTPAIGPNYQTQRGRFQVMRGEQVVATLEPEKRVYQAQSRPMTEAAIDPSLIRDLYVSLGEPLDNSAWSVRLYYKPAVRWIWLGGLLMALGGLIAASDRRYRLINRRPPIAPIVAT